MVEKALLGTLLVAPYLTERCSSLKASDFAEPLRGRIFAEIVELGDFADANMLVATLEAKNVHPPGGRGWGEAVGKMLDNYFVDDDAVVRYTQKIKEAAIGRRLSARSQSGSAY